MSEDPSANQDRLVEAWLTLVERTWASDGVSGRDRRHLAAELQRDVDQALAAGAPVTEVLDPDPARFARDLAAAQGVAVLAPSTPRHLAPRRGRSWPSRRRSARQQALRSGGSSSGR